VFVTVGGNRRNSRPNVILSTRSGAWN